MEFYVTEKIDGTAATWIYEVENNSLRIFSHNWEVGESGVWFDAARNIGLKEKMAFYCKNHNLASLVLQGEVIAPEVQKNLYNVSKADLFIYGMMTIEGRRYCFKEMKDACTEMEIKMVPVISESEYMPDNIETLLTSCEGQSTQADIPREGVVWRVTAPGEDIHFKVKSRPYKVWFDKKK